MVETILVTPENLNKNFAELVIRIEAGAIAKVFKDGKCVHLVKDYETAQVYSTKNMSSLKKVPHTALKKSTPHGKAKKRKS